MSTNKYSTGFSAGALLYKESESVINSINNVRDFMEGTEIVDYNCIPVNSEASKRRLYGEVSKRLKGLRRVEFIDLYRLGELLDKKLILFYAACKYYTLITHFMLDTIVTKWYNSDFNLVAYDFQSFIYKQQEHHSELIRLSDSTIKKLFSVIKRMLKDLGMVENETLKKVYFNERILKTIVDNGDNWFLDIILLNNKEQQRIIEA